MIISYITRVDADGHFWRLNKASKDIALIICIGPHFRAKESMVYILSKWPTSSHYAAAFKRLAAKTDDSGQATRNAKRNKSMLGCFLKASTGNG